MSYLLDTNIVSLILKNQEKVNHEYRELRRQGQKIFISNDADMLNIEGLNLEIWVQ